jgi:DNA-binding transcriptional LysR family regulator
MLDVPHDLSYEPVHWFDPMLILPPGHPLAAKSEIALADLSPYGLILPPQRLTTYRMIDLVFQQARVPYQVAIEVGGWEVIKQYVAMGLGISIVTGICIQPEDEKRLAVRNMRRYFPQRSYGVVVRKGKYLSPQARAFVDLIKPGMFARRDYYESGHSER